MELFIYKYPLVSELTDTNIAAGNGKPFKLAGNSNYRDLSYHMDFQVKKGVDC